MRVAIYARVSTSDGRQTTENQLRELRQYCEARDYDVTGVYTDDETGRKGRGALAAEPVEHPEEDQVEAAPARIVEHAVERRAGMAQTIYYFQQLEAAGVRFHSYTEPGLSTDNEIVRIVLLSLLSTFAKLESDRISRRTKAGLERARDSGKQLGRPSKVDVAALSARDDSER